MKKQIFLLQIFVLLLINESHAQTMYELTYQSPNNKAISAVTAFMVRFNSGSGYARLRYFDSSIQKEVLINADLEDASLPDAMGNPKEDAILVQMLHIKSVSPGITASYIPDQFLFRKAAGAEFFDPVNAVSLAGVQIKESADFLSPPKLIAAGETQKYILRYFNEGEPLYESFVHPPSRAVGDAPGKGMTLHLIIVADIQDSTIGESAKLDVKNVLKMYTLIRERLGISKFDTTVLQGDRFGKEYVNAAINKLKPGKNDIVVFYYSGHGFNDKNPKHKYPTMFLRTKKSGWQLPELPKFTLNIEDIYQHIVQKGARLNFVFSDCCNVIFPDFGKLSIGRLESSSRATKPAPSLALTKALFIDSRRNILATAAKIKEKSRCGFDGSFFTYSYLNGLEESISPLSTDLKPSWDKVLLTTAQKSCYYVTKKCSPKEAPDKPCIMNPIINILPGKTGCSE